MTPERWQRIKEVFEAALELAPEDRSEFIRGESKDDEDLQAQVVRIVEQVDQGTDLFDEPFWRNDSPAGSTFRDGQLVSGRYCIIRFIGRGGMGEVYEAEDTRLGGRLALKTIRPEVASDRKIVARFRQEIQLSRKVTHPNVCRVFDVEWDRDPNAAAEDAEETTYLTMELLHGETLAQRLKRGRMSCAEALPVVRQLAAALNAAHEAGVIHRDFKPSNIMLTSHLSGSVRTVVTDFGLARGIAGGIGEITLTEPMQMMGTPDYMAPEQIENGVVTTACDVYALGLVIYEMVTGVRPFKSDSAFQSAVKRLRHAPKNPRVLVPDVDPQCELAILRCLQMEPEKRGPVLEAVSPWTAESSQRERFTTYLNWQRWRTHGRTLGAVAALCVFLALLPLALRFYSRRPAISAGSTVLLTNVENLTGDHELDGITVAVRSQLNQSAFFNLLDDGRVRAGLQRMVLSPDHALDPETARQLARREGAPMIIYGSLSKLGQEYQFSLKLEHVSAGSLLPVGQSSNNSWSAGTKRELFDAIYEGAEWVRKQAGETREEMLGEYRRPEETTTDSWDALRLFSQAEDRKAHDFPAQAIELLHEATDRDPQFALAWMRAGDLAFSLNRAQEGYNCWRKALSVMDSRRLTAREHFRIQGLYAMDTGDYATAVNAFRRYAAHYPNDYLAWFYQAKPLVMLGNTEQALNALEEARTRDPGKYYTVSHIAMYQLLRGSFTHVPELAAWLRQHGQEPSALAIEGSLAFLQQDFDRAAGRFQLMAKSPRAESQSRGYYLEACLFAELGRAAEARKSLSDGIDFDTRKGDDSGRAAKLLALSYLDLRAHNPAAAGLRVKEAMKSSLSAPQFAQAGTLLARANLLADAAVTLKLLDGTLEGPFRDIAKHRITGEILLARGLTTEALAELQKAAALEPPFTPRDYLARAWEADGHPEEALTLYQSAAASPQFLWYLPDSQFPGTYADSLSDYARLLASTHRPELPATRAKLLKLRPNITEGGNLR